MAVGGANYTFDNNTVSYDASTHYGNAFKTLESYYNWLPRDYWTSLRSPLLRFDVPDGQTINFKGNKISQISWVEPMFKELNYNATILALDRAPGELNFTI